MYAELKNFSVKMSKPITVNMQKFYYIALKKWEFQHFIIHQPQ